jgi:YVTN family beta-propeller protein
MRSQSNRSRTLPFATALATLIAASLTGCGREPAQSSSGATGSAPQQTPHQIHIITSDETGGRVVVIDAASGAVIDAIPVGKRPRGLRALHDGTHVLVALSGSPIAGPGIDESKLPPADRTADGIGIVDLTTRRVVRMIKSGQDPEAFAISPDEQTLYVSNEETAEMSVVDLAKGEVRTRVAACEEPEGVTVRPGGREVYVTCEGANTVVAYNTQTNKEVARISTGPRPRGIAFTTDGATGFVTNENGAGLTVFNAATHRVVRTLVLHSSSSAPTPPRPMGVALSPDGRTLYVSNGRAQSVAALDVAIEQPPRMFENVGMRPWGIAVSPDGKTLYTANGPSGDVSFIDASTGAVQRKDNVGGSPWGLVLIVK